MVTGDSLGIFVSRKDLQITLFSIKLYISSTKKNKDTL